MRTLRLQFAFLAVLALTAACGGSDPPAPVVAPAPAPVAVPPPPPPPPPAPEEVRLQDSRTFTVTGAASTTFVAMAAAPADTINMTTTSRWAGVLGGAGYRVEVPATWNGRLVMYAHGYRGIGPGLTTDASPIRRHLIQNGYAWAASSYSKNYYDVRVGVEDTNALANEFVKIAAANGRVLAAPSKIYITGISMGGHVAAAAIEDETAATAINKTKYAGAVPMCGVVGGPDLFNTFTGFQMAAQALTGVPNYPFDKWSDISARVTSDLFTTFPAVPTALGRKYYSVLENLTGGVRPMFELGMSVGGSFPSAYGSLGGDGTISGILNKQSLDSTGLVYTITGDATGTASLNASVQKISPVADANRLRRDGLRWVPVINGEFKIPVVSIHTLGDMFVPFNMEQSYQKRAAAKGNSQWLVQRAIRGISHCDFTLAEQIDAFEAMVRWDQTGVKPAGDDVITPAVVASPTYGCGFTNNTISLDDGGTVRALRPIAIANSAVCPAR